MGRLRRSGLLFTVNAHAHAGSADPAFFGCFRLHGDLKRREHVVHCGKKQFLLVADFVKGAHKHVPRSTHIAFKKKCFHFDFVPPIWLIMLAR